jgi:hypothetical protein
MLPFVRVDRPRPSLGSNRHRHRILPLCRVVYIHRRPPEVSHRRQSPLCLTLFSALNDPSPQWARVNFSLPGALPVTRSNSRRPPPSTWAAKPPLDTAPPCRPQVWWPRPACARAAPWRPGWVGYFDSRIGPARSGPHGLSSCWPTRATRTWEQTPRANFSLGTVPSSFYYPNLFSDLNIQGNFVILLKYIENGLNLRKIQIKFP